MAKGYSIHPRSGGWHVRVRYKGKNVNQTFQRKTPADTWARNQVRSIDDGVFKRNTEFSDHAKQTLGSAVEEYKNLLPTRTTKEISRKNDSIPYRMFPKKVPKRFIFSREKKTIMNCRKRRFPTLSKTRKKKTYLKMPLILLVL